MKRALLHEFFVGYFTYIGWIASSAFFSLLGPMDLPTLGFAAVLTLLTAFTGLLLSPWSPIDYGYVDPDDTFTEDYLNGLTMGIATGIPMGRGPGGMMGGITGSSLHR